MPNLPVQGACDCHVHIVGSVGRFPQAAARTYTAELADVAALRRAAQPHGVTRFVVVQPSFYEADNSCTFGALETLGDHGRGIAVVQPDAATPALLRDWARRGIRGLRVNLYSSVSLAGVRRQPGEILQSLIDKIPSADWHVELLAPLPTIVLAAPAIAASAATIVIDHYGLPGALTPDSPDGRSLLELAALPHVWTKLSAPYRVLADPMATAPPAAWLNALLRIAPDRCVWGSDWPHTPPQEDQKGPDVPAPYRSLAYERVLGDFVAALPESALAERLLRTNPMRLYGFPSAD